MQNFSTIKFVVILTFVLLVGILGCLPIEDLPIRQGREILAGWILTIFIALCFVENIWIGLFLVWCLVGTIITNHEASLRATMMLTLCIVMYQGLVDRLNRKTIVYAMNIICLIGVIQMIWVILQSHDYWFLFKLKDINSCRFVGLLENTNISGCFLAVLMPLFFRGNKISWFRPSWFWFIPFIVYCIYLSETVTALVALSVGLLFWSYFNIKNYRLIITIILLVLLILGSFVFLINIRDIDSLSTLSGRTPIWSVMYERVFPVRPIRGMSLGMFKVIWPPIHMQYNGTKYPWVFPHNVYLRVLLETGIVGLSLLMFYLGFLFIKFLRYRSYVSTILMTGVVIIAVSEGASFLTSVSTGLVIVALLALLEKECELNKGERICQE